MATPEFIRPPQDPTEAFQAKMVALGLGTPSMRFVCASMTAAAMLLIAKPEFAFDEDGEMRKFKPLHPLEEGATNYHFFLVPLTAGLLFSQCV